MPIIILNAIPGFMEFLELQEMVDFDDNLVGAMMTGAWLITIIHAIIQYRFAGLWIAPVRILIGLTLGISVGIAIVLTLGLFLLLGVAASSEESDLRVANNTRRITRGGRTYEVYRMGDSEYFRDPETNDTLHVVDDSHFIDQEGNSFEMRK